MNVSFKLEVYQQRNKKVKNTAIYHISSFIKIFPVHKYCYICHILNMCICCLSNQIEKKKTCTIHRQPPTHLFSFMKYFQYFLHHHGIQFCGRTEDRRIDRQKVNLK
jgi:hypothetical protein